MQEGGFVLNTTFPCMSRKIAHILFSFEVGCNYLCLDPQTVTVDIVVSITLVTEVTFFRSQAEGRREGSTDLKLKASCGASARW
jgi:hypothetical protein